LFVDPFITALLFAMASLRSCSDCLAKLLEMHDVELHDMLQKLHVDATGTPLNLDNDCLKSIGRFINLQVGMKISSACHFVWSSHMKDIDGIAAKAAKGAAAAMPLAPLPRDESLDGSGRCLRCRSGSRGTSRSRSTPP
jgi:hypothetical protein